MDHLPRDTVKLCMESGCESELRRNSGFQKPSFVQDGALGKSAGEPDIKLEGGSGAPNSPWPSPAVAALAAESSLIRGTEAGEILFLLQTSLLC